MGVTNNYVEGNLKDLCYNQGRANSVNNTVHASQSSLYLYLDSSSTSFEKEWSILIQI